MHAKESAWAAYGDLQRQSGDATRIDDRYWGLDRAMDRLLDSLCSGTVPLSKDDREAFLRREISTGSRLERARESALQRHAQQSIIPCPHHQLEARIALSEVARSTKLDDALLLFDVGQGRTDIEIADRIGKSPGAVRTRVSRLRHKLAA